MLHNKALLNKLKKIKKEEGKIKLPHGKMNLK